MKVFVLTPALRARHGGEIADVSEADAEVMIRGGVARALQEDATEPKPKAKRKKRKLGKGKKAETAALEPDAETAVE